MTRATRQLTVAIPLVLLYLLMLLGVLPAPVVSEQTASAILPVIPFWLLVSFGAYSLSSLGLGLLRFRDCPEAYESLLAEISQAKNELRDKGVSVD
ncbi:dolichol-phosphate mannosyltransferase subunit 3 [Dioszegia hungarica]|uniref:Dolichol-phosphate mannosyltransferase subunit 3 n=1 Tax=Dioszegia hungarica TaxID=4972 RepID=A0AA38H8A5_9TREE|nr:dolichol-phosphate mannosyltransferase subunit 3 [Dioszegia hungarica]KAI9634284.1 dolichol-phosphate mannosyltransferase subunit 3 [Dioszegia hungarica]